MKRPRLVREGYPLSRLTTIGTGGPASYFARPGNDGELQRVLEWAAGDGVPFAVVCETYVARGAPDPDGSARRILDALAALRPDAPASWAPTLDDAIAILRGLVRAGDLVLCCGAGPVDRVAREVAA